MRYQVKIKEGAKRQISKLSLRDVKRVMIAIYGLSMNPYIGKKLDGEFKGFWSLRAWPFRIIYEIQKKELVVFVVKIGHRRDVYSKK